MRPTLLLTLAASALVAIACSGSPNATAPSEPAPDTAAETAATPETAEAPDPAAATTAEATAASKAAPATDVTYFAEEGIAIKGADAVAYFTAGDYVPGSSEFTYDWGGATWQFASAENRDAFAADPDGYAPQYGGYCAWAVSQGYTAPIDPTAWKIVDGKLYLNYDAKIQSRWAKDIPGNIAKANDNWPAVLTQ